MNSALSDIISAQIQFPAAQLLSCRTFSPLSSNRGYPFRLAASAVTIPQQTCLTPVVIPALTELSLKARAQVAVGVLPPRPCELKLKGITSIKEGDSSVFKRKRKRSSPLTIRMSENQKSIIRQKAEAAGISLGRYIRATVLGSDYTPPIDRELTNALLMLNREFTSQGNNLNQIAKHLNGSTITETQGHSMMDILGRSMLRTHKRIRQALSHGQTED